MPSTSHLLNYLTTRFINERCNFLFSVQLVRAMQAAGAAAGGSRAQLGRTSGPRQAQRGQQSHPVPAGCSPSHPLSLLCVLNAVSCDMDLICGDLQMQVTSLPTVMALSGRKVVDSFVGLLKPAELTKFVEGLLQDFARTHPQLSRNAVVACSRAFCVAGSQRRLQQRKPRLVATCSRRRKRSWPRATSTRPPPSSLRLWRRTRSAPTLSTPVLVYIH